MAASVGEHLGTDPGGACRGRLASGTACEETFQAQATVFLGELDPEDVCVELYLGLVNPDVELAGGASMNMEPKQSLDGGCWLSWGAEAICAVSGVHGYTVRVLPEHNDLATMFQLAYARRAG